MKEKGKRETRNGLNTEEEMMNFVSSHSQLARFSLARTYVFVKIGTFANLSAPMSITLKKVRQVKSLK